MDCNPLIVSVVRDFAMYDRCVRTNGGLSGCELRPIDNRESNDFIGVCYNRAIDSSDAGDERWLVFCHEDFEVKENLAQRLSSLDWSKIYGPVGAVTKLRAGFYYQWRMAGEIEESRKDGNLSHSVGQSVECDSPVDTLDCQCVIVHSSLLHKYGLRFDERLTFDLYVEDFCIAAKERHGIPSVVLPLKCHHWSNGNMQARYFKQVDYLKSKWPNAAYTGTAYQLIGGGGSWLWRAEVVIKQLLQRLLRKV